MTPKQQEDLAIEWQVTGSRMKQDIEAEYLQKYGNNHNREHWEKHLVEVLNIRHYWKNVGCFEKI